MREYNPCKTPVKYIPHKSLYAQLSIRAAAACPEAMAPARPSAYIVLGSKLRVGSVLKSISPVLSVSPQNKDHKLFLSQIGPQMFWSLYVTPLSEAAVSRVRPRRLSFVLYETSASNCTWPQGSKLLLKRIAKHQTRRSGARLRYPSQH